MLWRAPKPIGPAEEGIELQRLAIELLQYHARISTVLTVTGLDRAVVKKLQSHLTIRPTGRTPYNLSLGRRQALFTIQTAYALSCFDLIRQSSDVSPGRALSLSYCLYLQRFQSPLAAEAHCHVFPSPKFRQPDVTIDMLFTLAGFTYGIWGFTKSMELVTCPKCSSRFPSPPVTPEAASEECPFCRVATRYTRDPRVRAFIDDVSRPELDRDAAEA